MALASSFSILDSIIAAADGPAAAPAAPVAAPSALVLVPKPAAPIRTAPLPIPPAAAPVAAPEPPAKPSIATPTEPPAPSAGAVQEGSSTSPNLPESTAPAAHAPLSLEAKRAAVLARFVARKAEAIAPKPPAGVDKPFHCPMCLVGSQNRQGVVSHLRQVHKLDKPSRDSILAAAGI